MSANDPKRTAGSLECCAAKLLGQERNCSYRCRRTLRSAADTLKIKVDCVPTGAARSTNASRTARSNVQSRTNFVSDSEGVSYPYIFFSRI